MAIIIGLTGGIGSGKSTIAKVFASWGIPVFDADAAAKNIMNNSLEIKEKLKAVFGPEVYIKSTELSNEKLGQSSKNSGQSNEDIPAEILNRALLSKIVFSDPFKLELLNAIVHPITIQAALNWSAAQNAPYVIKEAALFFESGSSGDVQKIIGVAAPQSLRIHRVMHRDHCTRQEVLTRMSRQIDETLKMKLCDWVISNDDQQLVLPQIERIHKEILGSL
jgi:dephospho-CoA kinase